MIFNGCMAPWPAGEVGHPSRVMTKDITLVVTDTEGNPLTNATIAINEEDPNPVGDSPVAIQEGALYSLDAPWRYPVRFRIDAGLDNLKKLHISLDHLVWPNKTCHEGGRKLKGKLYSENEAPIENGVIEVLDRQASTDDSGAFNLCFAVHHDQSQALLIAKSATSNYRMRMTLVKNGNSDTLLDVFLDDSTDMIDPK